MFCERCGTKIPEGQTQCPNCQPNPVPVQQNMYYAQPGNHQGNFQLNTPAGMPGKSPKKKSEGVNLLLVGGVVLALLAVILVAAFSGVFSSPKGQLEKMEKANAKLIAEVAAQTYGTYLDAMTESFEMQEKGFGSRTDIKLSADKSLLTAMIAQMIGADMTSLDLSWLNNVMICMDLDSKDTQLALSLGVGVNDTILTTADAQLDLSKGDLYAGAPELNGQYLYMDLEQMGVSMEQILAAMEPMETLTKELPSEKEMRKMISSYLNIVFSYVDEVEKVKETVTIGEQTKELTVLKAKITQRKLIELTIELAEAAQKDETLKKLIQAMEEYMGSMSGQMGYGPMPGDLYEQLQSSLTEALAELEAELKTKPEDSDSDDYLLLSNYVSGGMIVGRRVELMIDGKSTGELARYMFLPGRNGGVFEAVAPDLKIDGVISGEDMDVRLTVEGEHVLTLRTQELELKDGVLNGKLRLVPGEALLEELTYSGMPAAMLADIYLQFDFEGSRTEGTTQLQLAMGGNVMVQVTVSAKEKKYESISAPTNTIPADGEEDLMTWVTGINLDSLVKNMQTAGVPNEYVQLVQQLEMILKMQGMMP